MSTEITATVEVNAFEANQLYIVYTDFYKRQKRRYECFKNLIHNIDAVLDEDLVEKQYERYEDLLDTYKLGYEKWLKIRNSQF